MGWPSSKRTYMVFPLSTLSSYPLDIHIEKAPSSASPCMPAWRRTCTPDSASAALRALPGDSVNSLRHDNHAPSSMHSLWGKNRADLHALDMSKRSPITVWNTMFAQCFRKKLKSSLPRCHVDSLHWEFLMTHQEIKSYCGKLYANFGVRSLYIL